jgi:hypothetical protein
MQDSILSGDYFFLFFNVSRILSFMILLFYIVFAIWHNHSNHFIHFITGTPVLRNFLAQIMKMCGTKSSGLP